MNKIYSTSLLLVLLFANNVTKTDETITGEMLAVVAGIFTAGVITTVVAENTIVPWITEKNEKNQRRDAYKKTSDIRKRHDEAPEVSDMSLPALKRHIQEVKKDRTTLETLQRTTPFNSQNPTKDSKPIETAVSDLTKKLCSLKVYYASHYLENIITQYNKELRLLKDGQLNQRNIKQLVDQSCGAQPYRNRTYIGSLKDNIHSYRMLIQKLNQNNISDIEKTKLKSLETLLRTATEVLTGELQEELEVKRKDQRTQELHNADIKRAHEEAAAYRSCKRVCNDLDVAVKTHNSMIKEIKQEVKQATQAVRQVTAMLTADKFIKIFEQSGSESRIINGVKTELNKILQQLIIIKERVKKEKSKQGNNYQPDPYYQPYPIPSAPPEGL